MPPLRRALSAAVLLVPVLITTSTAAECGTRRADGWVSVQPGAFTSGSPVLSDLAVLPRHPDTMVVSNGVALKVTSDAGCTWSNVALPPATGLLAPLAGGRAIVDVTVGQARTGTEAVWVLGQETGDVRRATALVSTDGGKTFAVADSGLPPVGEAVAIAAGPDATTAYLVVDLPSPLGRRLYATTDGSTWNAAAPTGEFAYDEIVVDTVNGAQLFAWNTEAIAVSFNGGAAFTPLDLGEGEGFIRDVALGQAPRGSRLAVLVEGGVVRRSDDGGRAWRTLRVDPRAEQVAAAPEIDAAAVAGQGLVTLLPSVFRSIDASPTGDEPLDLALGLVGGTEVRLVGRVTDAVMVYVGKLDPSALRGFDLRAARLAVPVDPALLPARTEVTLAPGETKVVDYDFNVPASPSPLEVFFLIDTTGSMGGVITGVREGLVKIVNDLAAAGIAAHFGVGEVKEYPFDNYSGPPDLPYKLFRKVGPVDDELADALAQLQAGGGGDGPESMTTGYYQLATGEGQTVRGQVMVPRGDDAGFSAGALRIVIASTDIEYHKEPGYLGPSLEKAHGALRSRGINVIGLAAQPGGAFNDLSRTAEDTGTFAPEHGVDCNGDGKPELEEGDPLVCLIASGAVAVNIGGPGGPIIETGSTNGIAPAIISLLRTITDPASLALRSSVPDVAKVVSAANVRVDLKIPHAVPYRVRLSCPPARYGTTVNARLAGLAGARELAAAAVNVRCLAPAPPPPEPEMFLDKVPRPLAAPTRRGRRGAARTAGPAGEQPPAERQPAAEPERPAPGRCGPAGAGAVPTRARRRRPDGCRRERGAGDGRPRAAGADGARGRRDAGRRGGVGRGVPERPAGGVPAAKGRLVFAA